MKSINFWGRIAVVAALLLLAVGGTAFAQLQTGNLFGTVEWPASWLWAWSDRAKTGAQASLKDGEWTVKKAMMSRSARVLMEGWVRVPQEG